MDGRPKRIKKFAFTIVCVYNRLRVDGALKYARAYMQIGRYAPDGYPSTPKFKLVVESKCSVQTFNWSIQTFNLAIQPLTSLIQTDQTCNL